MDVTMVDVTDLPDVAIGDAVTIMGLQGAKFFREPGGTCIGTVTSDLLCAVSARVPRFYMR